MVLPNKVSLKENIQKNMILYRKRAKITQKELSDLIGVGATTVSGWERGACTPDIDTLLLICNILNVSFTDMCGLESSPNDFSCTANERREIGIYENLKSRRLELGLTMREVAISLGVTEATISRYESGDIHNMGIDKLKSLAKILNCEPAYLMGMQNEPFRLSTYEETLVTVSRALNNDGKQKLIERAETLHDLGYSNRNNIKMA